MISMPTMVRLSTRRIAILVTAIIVVFVVSSQTPAQTPASTAELRSVIDPPSFSKQIPTKPLPTENTEPDNADSVTSVEPDTADSVKSVDTLVKRSATSDGRESASSSESTSSSSSDDDSLPKRDPVATTESTESPTADLPSTTAPPTTKPTQSTDLAILYPIGSSSPNMLKYFGQFSSKSSGVTATVTEETLSGFDPLSVQMKDRLPGLRAKYCGSCRRYLGHVPDKGARIGHFIFHWEMAFDAAHQFNLTFLYHPILPNQAERYLFEGLFGYGLDEPYRYREICLEGQVGSHCTRYLDCLKVRSFADMTKLSPDAKSLQKLMDSQKNDCDVVYVDPDKTPRSFLVPSIAIEETLRHKYATARKLMPIESSFDKEKINVAIHIRRGDVTTKKNQSRYTTNESYVKLIQLLREVLASLSTKPVQFHIFSQGNKNKDFAELVEEKDVAFHLDDSLVWTIHHLISADIMIVARSGFSGMCARLRHPQRLTMYADGFGNSPNLHKRTWLAFNNDNGQFNKAAFQRQFEISNALPHEFQ